MVLDCQRKEKNTEICNCTYDPCPRKGICCECIAFHRRSNELPACFFSARMEKTYDRSVKAFIRDQS